MALEGRERRSGRGIERLLALTQDGSRALFPLSNPLLRAHPHPRVAAELPAISHTLFRQETVQPAQAVSTLGRADRREAPDAPIRVEPGPPGPPGVHRRAGPVSPQCPQEG